MTGDINLVDGENSLMKVEMAKICKEAMSNNVTDEELMIRSIAFANPKDFAGDTILRDALASSFTNYFNPSTLVTREHIVTTARSGSCLDAVTFTICDAGDSTLATAPHWWGYGPFARIHAEVNIIPAYTPKLSGVLTSAVIPALEAAYTAATDQKHIKAVITLNSNGPFMQCYPAEVLRGIRYFCDTHGLHFISDEAYANTVFGAKATPFTSALALIKGEENGSSRVEQSTIDPSLVHVIWSATKDFGSTGIRSGCIVSRKPLVRAGVTFATVWQISSLTNIFLTALLTPPQLRDLLSSTLKRLATSYHIVIDALTELSIDYVPATAGLFVNANVKDTESNDVIVKAAKAGVVVGTGTEFNSVEGERGWIRITFALPEDVTQEGMRRFKILLDAS